MQENNITELKKRIYTIKRQKEQENLSQAEKERIEKEQKQFYLDAIKNHFKELPQNTEFIIRISKYVSDYKSKGRFFKKKVCDGSGHYESLIDPSYTGYYNKFFFMVIVMKYDDVFIRFRNNEYEEYNVAELSEYSELEDLEFFYKNLDNIEKLMMDEKNTIVNLIDEHD